MTAPVSVVAPVYNNSSSVAELIDRVLAMFDAAGLDGELVLVDDGSADESWSLIRRGQAADDRVVGIKLSRNFGQHPAIAAGFAAATGRYIVLMDADLQDYPEEIPRLLEQFSDPEIDVVFTTFITADDVREKWTSKVFHRVFAMLAGLDLPRNLGTFRALTADYRDAVLDYPERSAVYGPLMAQMGYNQAWVEVQRARSSRGQSSYSFRRRLSLAVNSILTYADLPYRVLTWGGGLLMLATFAYLALVVGQYLFGDVTLPNGLTLVLSAQVFLSGSILVGLGVLGGYVHRVFREVLGRPRYHVARQVGDGLRRDR